MWGVAMARGHVLFVGFKFLFYFIFLKKSRLSEVGEIAALEFFFFLYLFSLTIRFDLGSN